MSENWTDRAESFMEEACIKILIRGEKSLVEAPTWRVYDLNPIVGWVNGKVEKPIKDIVICESNSFISKNKEIGRLSLTLKGSCKYICIKVKFGNIEDTIRMGFDKDSLDLVNFLCDSIKGFRDSGLGSYIFSIIKSIAHQTNKKINLSPTSEAIAFYEKEGLTKHFDHMIYNPSKDINKPKK